MKIGNYEFKGGGACPEQYDVFDKDGNQFCYVRLRWGGLTAECPDVGGTCVYSASIGDGWTGEFLSDQQRIIHLRKIAKRIELFKHHVYCPECCEKYDLHEYDLEELSEDGETWIECPLCLAMFRLQTVEKVISEHPDLGVVNGGSFFDIIVNADANCFIPSTAMRNSTVTRISAVKKTTSVKEEGIAW